MIVSISRRLRPSSSREAAARAASAARFSLTARLYCSRSSAGSHPASSARRNRSIAASAAATRPCNSRARPSCLSDVSSAATSAVIVASRFCGSKSWPIYSGRFLATRARLSSAQSRRRDDLREFDAGRRSGGLFAAFVALATEVRVGRARPGCDRRRRGMPPREQRTQQGLLANCAHASYAGSNRRGEAGCPTMPRPVRPLCVAPQSLRRPLPSSRALRTGVTPWRSRSRRTVRVQGGQTLPTSPAVARGTVP